jgi:hypothetical protein
MKIKLIEAGWEEELRAALEAEHATVRIVSPFIKRHAAERLLDYGHPETLQVVTRFSLADFCAGVSDMSALRVLVEAGAEIRGVRHLHAKLYLFGKHRAIVTSANLTQAGLQRNHEFGFISDDRGVTQECRRYFKRLWDTAGADLRLRRLAGWEEEVEAYLAGAVGPLTALSLPDHGSDAGSSTSGVSEGWAAEATQAFVKFFGKSDGRVSLSEPVFAEVRRSGCHWACTYPRGKRPRAPRDGALMLLGRMVANPDDIRVFGRAVGLRYKEGRDDATEYDINQRPFKNEWPHYIRVHHAEFVTGDMANGISLNELMDQLGSASFASTMRNAAAGRGNTNPHHAYQQQPAVELTREGQAWLNERLERAFEEHGQIEPATLQGLDWPVAEVATA